MSSPLDTMYKEIVLEHSKDPRCFGPLEDADVTQKAFNPLCGDRIELRVKLDPARERIVATRFEGQGCSICMASSSIMAEESEGESVRAMNEQIERFRQVMQGKEDPSVLDGDAEALAGVRAFPVRIKCALLAWMAMKDALKAAGAEGAGDDDRAGFVTQTE